MDEQWQDRAAKLKNQEAGEAKAGLEKIAAPAIISREPLFNSKPPAGFGSALIQQALANFFSGILPGFARQQTAIQSSPATPEASTYLPQQQLIRSSRDCQTGTLQRRTPVSNSREGRTLSPLPTNTMRTPLSSRPTRNAILNSKSGSCWKAARTGRRWHPSKFAKNEKPRSCLRPEPVPGWLLRSFATYCHERKWVSESVLKEAMKIPLLCVNHRQIQIPPPEATEEWLKMCEAEDALLGSFIRFIATTGAPKDRRQQN